MASPSFGIETPAERQRRRSEGRASVPVGPDRRWYLRTTSAPPGVSATPGAGGSRCPGFLLSLPASVREGGGVKGTPSVPPRGATEWQAQGVVSVNQSCPSASQVDKAAKVIRRVFSLLPVDDIEGFALDGDDTKALNSAWETMLDFRAAHQYPLGKATMGLRSVLKTEQCEVEVSQRLKRVATIVDKIMRYPKMRLSAMQDIGGCRAVLRSIDEVRAVERRLKKNRRMIRYSDYITEPKGSGYRGVHVVVEYDNRAIEVQLRTHSMHEWAITVERLSGRLQEDLKSSKGPPEVLDLMSTISEAMALEESGHVVGQELLDRMAELRTEAVPYLSRGANQ